MTPPVQCRPRLFAALLFLWVFVLWVPVPAAAQEEPPLDWDFDTLFDEPEEISLNSPAGGSGNGPEAPEKDGSVSAAAEGNSGLAGLLRRSGFSLDLSYSANGGFSPGWSESPWFAGDYESAYTNVLGVNLYSYLGMDVRVSESFRAHSSIGFTIPEKSGFFLNDFYIDYTLFKQVFFRVGKFGHNWGISPNFPAANLLSRIPPGSPRHGGADWGDPYILKVDIPIGIGGLQLLTLTRPGFIQGSTPEFKELGYGGKYNLAFTWADIDVGMFYHQEMPLRGFASIKTTIKDTELYLETLGVVQPKTWDGYGFSVNAGLVQDLFNDRVTVNAEIFWNGEDDAYYFKPKTELDEAKSSPFISGLNAAWNLVFRPPWIWDLRFAITGRWALDTNTAYILPGLSFSPLSHLDVSLGFPIALGGREGRYYRSNADKNGRPFGIALLVNLHGSYYRDLY
ncbi:MAG: hypothetical protein LBC51_09730 [Treponema sp.]|jgi:hypothetical protein|nr:hypothetical protein [Treponema sp.]